MALLNVSRRLSLEEIQANFRKQNDESKARAKRIAEEVRVAQALKAKNDAILAQRAAEYKANRAIEVEGSEYIKAQGAITIVSSMREIVQSAYQGKTIRGAKGRFLKKTGT